MKRIFCFILLICVAEALAVSCIKKYNASNANVFFMTAVLLYSLVCYLLSKTFQTTGLGMTIVMWSALSIFLVTSCGIMFFGEHLTTRQLVAGALLLGAMYVLHC